MSGMSWNAQKIKYLEKIGTVVKMETKNMHIESGQLQVYCSSLKDCKSIIRERGLSPFLRCPIIL